MTPVIVTGWLAFNENGSARWTMREPQLERGWRAMQIKISVPRAIFRTPILKASINVSGDDMPDTFEINADALADTIKTTLGVDVSLEVITPEPEA